MSKSYKVLKTVVHMGPKNGKTLYSVRPYSYGTLTTDEVAKQISMESTATPADVKAVLDRYCLLCEGEPEEGLRHRAARLRQALPPLHHQRCRGGREECQR